jgi:hypothetical protein
MSMLTETLKNLRPELIRTASMFGGGVGCPFNKAYGGPRATSFRSDDIHCKELCDVLYKNHSRLSKKDCPCCGMSVATVKRVFWDALEKAKEESC